MKSILLLCLFALLSCKLDNVIEKASCILKNEKAAKVIVEIFDHIKRKQYSLIPKLLINDYSELKKIVEKCLKPNEVDDVLLKANRQLDICLRNCLGKKACILACEHSIKKYN